MKLFLSYLVVAHVLSAVNSVSRSANCGDRTYVFAITVSPTVRVVGSEIYGIVSIIRKACQLAHKKCEFVPGNSERCSDGLVSQVLDTREADACGLTTPRAVKKLGYRFEDLGIMQTSKAVVIVKKKSKLTLDDLQNPKLKLKIASLDFFRGIQKRLECYFDLGFFAKGGVVKVNFPFSFSLGMKKIIQKVEKGEVDLGLTYSRYLGKDDSVRILKTFTNGECPSSADVLGFMTRKDESLLEWFNPAFLKLACSDDYDMFCDSLNRRLGLQDPLCIQVHPSKCPEKRRKYSK